MEFTYDGSFCLLSYINSIVNRNYFCNFPNGWISKRKMALGCLIHHQSNSIFSTKYFGILTCLNTTQETTHPNRTAMNLSASLPNGQSPIHSRMANHRLTPEWPITPSLPHDQSPPHSRMGNHPLTPA